MKKVWMKFICSKDALWTTDMIQQSPNTKLLKLSSHQNGTTYFLSINYYDEYQFLSVSWKKSTRSRVVQTINLKQGVTGADAAAAIHDLKTSQQDKIFQAKVQNVKSYILNTVLYD